MSNVSHTQKPRSLRRSKKRGAAMVEAAIVMPVLITCFGVTMLAAGARYTKQFQQQTSRQGVLDYATHACQSGGGGIAGGGGDPLGDITSGHSDADPSNASGSGDGRVDTGINDAIQNTTSQTKSFGTASGGPGAKTFAWSKAYVNGSISVTAHSFYFCNEKGWGSWGFFGYAKDLVESFLP